MSLIIRNLQKMVNVPEKQLFTNTKLILHVAGFSNYDLGIMLVCDSEIAEINKKYRDIDEVTDVLAFPFHEIPVEKAGQLPDVNEEEQMLGDIVLGMPYIQRQASENKTDLMSEVMTNITHGVCHLVGYDHQTPSSWSAMYNKEFHILERFNQKTGYTCLPLLKVGHYLKGS